MTMMRAAVFEKQGSIRLREVAKPKPGVGEALVRVTLTTICGTHVHILRGEYPVQAGLIPFRASAPIPAIFRYRSTPLQPAWAITR